jgi:hypothetical protein
MPDEGNKLKLGKGSAFVKRDLRQLPQTEDVWEADFLPLPRKGRFHEWLGIVVSRRSNGRVVVIPLPSIPLPVILAIGSLEACKTEFRMSGVALPRQAVGSSVITIRLPMA